MSVHQVWEGWGVESEGGGKGGGEGRKGGGVERKEGRGGGGGHKERINYLCAYSHS